jgi:hypothetical protein
VRWFVLTSGRHEARQFFGGDRDANDAKHGLGCCGSRRLRDHGVTPLVGDGEVVADERLGGLLRSYRRSA